MLTLHAISRLEGGAHDGIHLLWSPPYPTGHSISGFTIYRRDASQGQKQVCREIKADQLDQARKLGVLHVADFTIWARPSSAGSGTHETWTYRIDLGSVTNGVNIMGQACVVAFAARSDATIVAAKKFEGNNCRLSAGAITTVWIIAQTEKATFRICLDVEDDGSWKRVPPLVKELQVPFRSVNPVVSTEAQEHALAVSRALPDTLSGAFSDLSTYANLALQRPHGVPAFRIIAGRLGGTHDNWDLAPYPLSIAAIALSEWSRALGFAHLDKDGLTHGGLYDYRIVGTVPRADRDEIRYDFHTVPRDYLLPQNFVLGPMTVWLLEPTPVQAESSGGSPAVLRKGVKFKQLTLDLSIPSTRLIVDGSSGMPIMARGFMLNSHVADRSLVLSERSEFDFGAPVDRVVLEGEGFLVAVVPGPIAAGLDPKEPVEIAQTIHGIAYVATSPPPPPSALDVLNLGDPARIARTGVLDANRGFEVSWLPPLVVDSSLSAWWPVDAGSFLPTAVARYQLERQLGSGGFTSRSDTDGLHLGARLVQSVTDTPAAGFDVLRAFPVTGGAVTAIDERIRAIEVFEPDLLEYGELVSYRVCSVDATGRTSTPTVAAPVMLRKSTRPPMPVSPPTITPDEEGTPQTGIQVRLLQANDPDLIPADRALTSAGDVVIVKWGWGHAERQLDPYVNEFRVYEHYGALLEIVGTLNGPASAAGGRWRVPVSFSRAVDANEFSGRVIVLNDAFTIWGHGAGHATTVELDVSVRNPATVPTGSRFSVVRSTGAQVQPEYWDRRVQVVPRVFDPAREDEPNYIEEYTVILPAHWVAVSPAVSTQRAAIGVSAADAEPYVPDRRAAVETVPRSGNESTVTAVEVTARYRGRPLLAIADLSDVQEKVLRRIAATESLHVFVPGAVAPTGASLHVLMRLERVAVSAILPRLLIQQDGIFIQPEHGAAQPWPLSSADEAELRAGHAQGVIPDRFLAHAAARLDGLDRQAVKVGDINPLHEIADVVPNVAGRWVYRLRAVDAAGHLSAQSQVLSMVLRVPTPARATPPEMLSLTQEGEEARLTIRSRGTEATQILIFTSLDPRQRLAQASLSTIRNRPDLDPTLSVVVRDDRGVRLPATEVQIAANTESQFDFALPDGHRLLTWSLAISADGVPSPLVGPLHVSRGYLAEEP